MRPYSPWLQVQTNDSVLLKYFLIYVVQLYVYKVYESILDTKFELVDWLTMHTYACGSNPGPVLIINRLIDFLIYQFLFEGLL